MKYAAILLLVQITFLVSDSNGRKPTTKAPNPCQGLPTDTFVSNPRGCKYMYHCRDGQPFDAFCPGEMWFNSDSGICDSRENVDCHLDDAKPPKNQKELIVCPLKDSKLPNFISSSIDCGRYYLCYHGQPIQRQCVSDLQWNDEKKQCDLATKVNCTIASDMPQCPMNGQVFFPHTTECNYFVFCHNGFASIQQCPFFFHWDVQAGMCKWRTLARCGASRPIKHY